MASLTQESSGSWRLESDFREPSGGIDARGGTTGRWQAEVPNLVSLDSLQAPAHSVRVRAHVGDPFLVSWDGSGTPEGLRRAVAESLLGVPGYTVSERLADLWWDSESTFPPFAAAMRSRGYVLRTVAPLSETEIPREKWGDLPAADWWADRTPIPAGLTGMKRNKRDDEPDRKILEELADLRQSHATLMRGIKSFLGLAHWPELKGNVAKAVVRELLRARRTAKSVVRPVFRASDGRIHFTSNRLVVHLRDCARTGRRCDMSDLADLVSITGISQAEREEFLQLIGYPVEGYSEMPYVSDASRDAADAAAKQYEAANPPEKK